MLLATATHRMVKFLGSFWVFHQEKTRSPGPGSQHAITTERGEPAGSPVERPGGVPILFAEGFRFVRGLGAGFHTHGMDQGMNQRLGWGIVATMLVASVAVGQPVEEFRRNAEVHRDLVYVPDGHERQTLDLYLPGKIEEPVPVVVWVHGGGWRTGSKDGLGPSNLLLSHGYAVASINYRLSHHAAFPAQIQDCFAAVRYLRAHADKYGLDPERVAAWGASAGGHLVALMASASDREEFLTLGPHRDQSPQVSAVINWFGPADFATIAEQDERVQDLVSKLLGVPAAGNPDKCRVASPVTYVTRQSAPMLIYHGDEDPLVPHDQSVILEKAYKTAGAEVELFTLKGGGHGGLHFLTDASLGKATTFFDRHLKPAAAD